MDRSRRAIVSVVAVLAAIQLAIIVGLKWSSKRDDSRALVHVVAVDRRPSVLALVIDTRAEKTALLTAGRPMIVHVWATWCEPCREELPELLRAIPELEARGVSVLLASVDETWPVIDHFFDGATPAAVVRVRHEDARDVLLVEAMPTSVLVDSEGRLTHRLPGAQPWSSTKTREQVLDLVAR